MPFFRAGQRGKADGEARQGQPRIAQGHGERHPCARHGCGREGQIRPPRHAHGHGGCGDGAVHPVPEVRRRRARLAGPRPVRALGRPRLDAALCAAPPHRLSRRDHGRAAQLPAARLHDGRPPGAWARPRHRDHHRPAGPGPRQRRRHGPGGAPAECPAGRRHRRSLHLCARRRRLPDGGHQPRGDLARRPPQAQQADRAVRRQPHLHRRTDRACRLRRPGEAFRGFGLGRHSRGRPRPRGYRRRHRAGAEVGPADPDRLQDRHRLRRADQGRQGLDPRLPAWSGGDRRSPRQARLDARALRGAGRRARRLARLRGARLRLRAAPGQSAGRASTQEYARPSSIPRERQPRPSRRRSRRPRRPQPRRRPRRRRASGPRRRSTT